MKNGQISVVVPCFNEEKTIYSNIKKIADYLAPRFGHWEIIAVNDGSADQTERELLKIKQGTKIKIINNTENQGKGGAVKRGILACHYDTVMFLDADLGIPIEELEKFMVEISNGCDLAIASRFVPGLKIVRPVQWHRKLMEKVFRIMRMMIINDWNIKDTQCGFKVFRKSSAMKIFSKATVKRFAFDAELIFIANKLKCRIKELPISLQNPPNSHIRIVRDPLNMIWDLLRIKINDWKGKYK
jgi:dolichyl-phosphate beta-glucosyltransferase